MSQFPTQAIQNEFSAFLPTASLELDKVGQATRPLRVLGLSVVTMQAANTTGAWGTGVVSLKQSNDGEHWEDFDTAVTANSDTIERVDVASVWVRAEVTTAGSAGHYAAVTICGRI